MQVPTTIIGAATLVACLMLGASERGTAQGTAQGVQWEYGQIVTNPAGLVLAWTAPDSQHVYCPPDSVTRTSDDLAAHTGVVLENRGKLDREVVVIMCELHESLWRIAMMDIALNAHPSPDSYKLVKADTTHYPDVQTLLNLLGREGWEVTGPPELRSFPGNRLYTLKRSRPR